MKYKVIASDMDETLLNDQHVICQRNIDLIRLAKEKGVKFVPATGRGFMSIQRDLKLLGLYDIPQEYVISFNGGALTENKNNQLLYFEGLSFEKTKERIYTNHKGCFVCFFYFSFCNALRLFYGVMGISRYQHYNDVYRWCFINGNFYFFYFIVLYLLSVQRHCSFCL